MAFALPRGARINASLDGIELTDSRGRRASATGKVETAILTQLQTGPHSVSELVAALPAQRDEELRSALAGLVDKGLVGRTLLCGSDVQAEVEAIGTRYRARGVEPVGEDLPVVLSRFCLLRSDGDALILESPLGHSRLRILRPEMAAVIATLATARTVGEAQEASPGIDPKLIADAVALLVAEGFASAATDPASVSEAPDPLRCWEFHDLLFHSRSRIGRHDYPLGATYRFKGEIPPEPAVKPPMAAAAIPLHRPDMSALQRGDPPLAAVMEARASLRSHTRPAITAAQLGEFLFRVARIRARLEAAGIELTNRPYPNGGASYELELYPVVDRCSGLLPGLYHYQPEAHALEPLRAADAATESFLADATGFCAQLGRPQILFLITARFPRVSWKYSSMAYATILKNVGSLYQTMYLAGIAMGLAPCALGCGDSDRLSALLGENYYAEGGVGEFMLCG